MFAESEWLNNMVHLFARLNPFTSPVPLIDIALVTGLFYWILKTMWGTRAVQLIQGILVIVVLVFVLALSPFETIRWIVVHALQPALVVAIPVVFQPELRRLLESLGQSNRLWYANFRRRNDNGGRVQMINNVARSAMLLSQQGIGALIVLERNVGLQDYADRGVHLDARTSVPLLMAIFHPNAPLHDMAVLIRGERILAANVVLPLSEEMGGVRRYGTRHRAARGITEQSDAVAVVVSEETGAVTMFHDGQMISQLNEERIGVLLVELLRVDTETGREVVA